MSKLRDCQGKKCPFCGGDPEIRKIDFGISFKHEYAVECSSCHVMTEWLEDIHEALNRWEERV